MPAGDQRSCLAGGGEAGARLRAIDWASNPLGPVEDWPLSLQAAVRIVLNSKFPMMLHWGPELTTIYNDAYAPSLGTKHPGNLGRPAREWWSEIWDQLAPIFDQVLSGEPFYVEDAVYRPDRGGVVEEAFFTHCHSPLWDDQGRIAGIFLVVTETTRRVLAERRLVQANAELEAQVQQRTLELTTLWATSADLLLVIGFDGVIRRVNPAWTTMLGYGPEELVGRHVTEFVLPEDHAETIRAYILASEGGQPRIVNRYRHKDGSTRWISWIGVPAGELTYASGRDVTAERAQMEALAQAEDALRQSQKMEAVGQLTGGLAHDFNNMLAGITGALELMERRIAQGRAGEIDRYMAAAQDAAKRAAALTHRLLAFSRRQTLDARPTNVSALVEGMTELIRRTVGPGITVETISPPAAGAALVDASQLENALLNLCINARDAMPDGGRIIIETAERVIDATAARASGVPAGRYLALSVSDTGAGMSAETLARVFEPFYTTKPIGQGTGLGLSMIYGFVQQSGGQVRIQSRLGEGAAVTLYLPWHAGEAPEQGPHAPPAHRVLAKRGDVALVVDDEATVRLLVSEVLADLGYTVIEAVDGAAGLTVLQSDARVDLLITDVGLPGGMNGRQMAEAARQSRGDLRTLFITGFAEAAVVGGEHLGPGMQILTKPFSIEALAARVRDLTLGR